MPINNILNQIVIYKDNIPTTYTIGDIIEGYYNSTSDKFYKESTFITEIEGASGFLYVDLNTKILYIYKSSATPSFVQVSGSGGGLEYVDTLPSPPDIKNAIYGYYSTDSYSETVTQNFLDENEFFVKTGDDYAPKEGIDLTVSDDDTTYKALVSLVLNGTDYDATYDDSTTHTFVNGDTFYFKVGSMKFYAGNEDNQILYLFSNGGGGGSESSGGTIEGYYNSEDGKFYQEETFITEILGQAGMLYVDLGENKTYRYDELEAKFIVIGGGGTEYQAGIGIDITDDVISGDYKAGFGVEINDDIIKTTDFVGTQADWNSLTPAQQAEYDFVHITDDSSAVIYKPGHSISDGTTEKTQRDGLVFDGFEVTDDSTNEVTKIAEIPYTAGDGIEITNKEVSVGNEISRTWTGTKAEWDAISDKSIYDGWIINITDDMAVGSGPVVDVVEDGNLNAVTSNAVYEAIQSGGGGGTIDPTPTEGSTNAVQSGGTYTALKNEAKTRGNMGAKNRFPHITLEEMKNFLPSSGTWADNVYTNGVLTCTFNENTQSLTFVTNGTYSNALMMNIPSSFFNEYLIGGEEYIISGYDGSYPGGIILILMNIELDQPIGGIGYPPQFVDGKFTYPNNGIVNLQLYIQNVDISTPITIQPMIRLASDIDDTYQPFTLTNSELAQTIEGIIPIDTIIDGDMHSVTSNAVADIVPKIDSHWEKITWQGTNKPQHGSLIWTDGDNIYYSNDSEQYVLNKSTLTWSTKTWNGLTSFDGNYIWTDGDNIYYSDGSIQYVLDKSTSTWSTKTWSGLTTGLLGIDIWTDGTNIYCSDGSIQYVLDKSTSTWSTKTWNGLTGFGGDNIWTDGTNIYYSNSSNHYVLDKSTSTWSTKTWSGLTNFYGRDVWTDGNNIYYSYSISGYNASHYILNGSSWEIKNNWEIYYFSGEDIWSDSSKIYWTSDYKTCFLIDAEKGFKTAAGKNFTTSVENGNTNLVTSSAVYNYVDTMITQALNAGY